MTAKVGDRFGIIAGPTIMLLGSLVMAGGSWVIHSLWDVSASIAVIRVQMADIHETVTSLNRDAREVFANQKVDRARVEAMEGRLAAFDALRLRGH